MYIPYLISQVISLSFLLTALGLAAVAIGTNYWSEITYATREVGPETEDGRNHAAGYEMDKADGLWRECATIFSVTSRSHNDVASTAAKRSLVYEYCFNRYQNVIDQSRQPLADAQVESSSFGQGSEGLHWWQITCMALMCTSTLIGAAATFTTPLRLKRCGGLTAFLVLIAAVTCATGIVIYSCTYDRQTALYQGNLHLQLRSTFGWSLWCAVGACACFLFATAGFNVSAKLRSVRDYSRVV